MSALNGKSRDIVYEATDIFHVTSFFIACYETNALITKRMNSNRRNAEILDFSLPRAKSNRNCFQCKRQLATLCMSDSSII